MCVSVSESECVVCGKRLRGDFVRVGPLVGLIRWGMGMRMKYGDLGIWG